MNAIFINHVDEKVADIKPTPSTEKILRRNIKWIARSINAPIIETVFGNYNNPYCHARLDLS